MDRETGGTLIAAAVLMLVFGVGAYYLPRLVIALGEVSPFAGGAVAALFVAAFFLVFWLRARSRRGR
jgi:hypothetical protein